MKMTYTKTFTRKKGSGPLSRFSTNYFSVASLYAFETYWLPQSE